MTGLDLRNVGSDQNVRTGSKIQQPLHASAEVAAPLANAR